MKPCEDRWREALVDYVLGLPASASLKRHLSECTVCPATLRDWQSRMGKIDASVRQLGDSEPSPDAVSRLLAQVPELRQRVWLQGRERRAAMSCAFAILLIASLTYVWRLSEQRKEAQKALSAAFVISNWRSPTESLLQSSINHWLGTHPQFGEYFYRLDASVPAKERVKQ